jgi:hypothetical protein
MKHKFVLQKPDSSDPTVVNASNWNDVHITVPRAISTTQTGPSNEDWVQATGGSSGITYTLPATPYVGQRIMIHKVDSGAGAITILPGTGTINSLNGLANTSYTLINPGQYVELVYDGSNWWVVNEN